MSQHLVKFESLSQPLVWFHISDIELLKIKFTIAGELLFPRKGERITKTFCFRYITLSSFGKSLKDDMNMIYIK